MASLPDYPDKPWANQWLLYLGLLILGLFAWLPDGYTLMRDWYWIAVWQGGFLAVGLWFLLSLRDYPWPWRPLGYGLDWGVGMLAIALFLSMLGAASPKAASWYFVMVVGHGVLLYALRNWLQQGELWQRLWTGLSIVGVGSAIISLALWLPQGNWLTLCNGFPLGTYGAMGGYLVLLLPMVLALAIAAKIPWQKWVWFGGAGVMLLDLYTTASRSALLAIAVVGSLSYLVSLINLRRDFSGNRLLLRTGLFGAVLLAVALNPRIFATAYWQSIEPDMASQLNLTQSLQNRFLLWVTSIDMVQMNPLNGIGMGHVGRSLDLFRPLTSNAPETPHLYSTPLQILSELGLYGIVASLLLLFMVMRLWLSMLPYVEKNSPEELLLYGLGAGWASYGLVCFANYQLEFLPISIALVGMLTLLLAIAQRYDPDPPSGLPRRDRRVIQVTGLSLLTVMLHFGLPMTIATAIYQQAQASKAIGNTSQYEQQLQEVHRLIPWQQSAMVDLGLHYWQQRQEKLAGELAPGEFEQLNGKINTYLRAASLTLPNDALLQYNEGAIAIDANPERTSELLENLLDNGTNRFPYTFYLLAQSYLDQNIHTDKIADLLALQLLQTPDFITVPRWQKDSQLAAFKAQAYEEAIATYKTLLNELPPTSAEAQSLYETMLLMQWWQQDFLGQVSASRLQPVVQALILAESQPQRSLEILNTALSETPDNLPIQLLKAWFDPEFAINIERPNGESVIVSQPSALYDTLQAWIIDIFPSELVAASPVSDQDFRYRDPNLKDVAQIIPPANLREIPMVKLLGLFGDRPTPKLTSLIQEKQASLLSELTNP